MPEPGPAVDRVAPVATFSGKAKKKRFVRKMERGIRKCANSRRRKRGMKPLTANRKLGDAARYHAQKMAKGGFFGHVDPQGRDVRDRVRRFGGGFSALGENIAGGQRSAAAACRAWMRSGGHRGAILGGYTHVGGGFAPGGQYRRYYVMVLGR